MRSRIYETLTWRSAYFAWALTHKHTNPLPLLVQTEKHPPHPPPSTRRMAQWESTRLEAEARLSKESLFLNLPPSLGTPSSDYFLRIWNSEVGESFRNVNKTSCQSPVFSQASSSAKCGSVSGPTTEIGVTLFGSDQNEDMEFKSGNVDTDNVMDSSDSSSSNELDVLSDTALQLLFDFPGNHGMSFLEHDDNYAFMSCHIWLKQPSLYCRVLMLEPLLAANKLVFLCCQQQTT